MNIKRTSVLLAFFVVILLLLVQTVNAQTVPPECYWDPAAGQVVCPDGETNEESTTGGEGSNNVCVPSGSLREIYVYNPNTSTELGGPACRRDVWLVDSCGIIIRLASSTLLYDLCPQAEQPPLPPPSNPCNISPSWTGSDFSVSCSNSWECIAAVPLPPTYIDVRPYPVTLVRWPTAIRCSGQGTSNGSCFVSTAGQMRNLRLSLEFRPATGVVTVTLPYLPALTLNASSPTSQPVLFQWEVPSHPAVGGNVLAGTLGGFFDEIPADFPVFVGQMKTPYRLYWRVSFERNEYGNWVGYLFSGELLPQNVRDLPASMIADLNGDGTGDAYWDPNFVISRMDENNRTNNPLYERHWSYGELLPWAIREGQGQIGWPGVP